MVAPVSAISGKAPASPGLQTRKVPAGPKWPWSWGVLPREHRPSWTGMPAGVTTHEPHGLELEPLRPELALPEDARYLALGRWHDDNGAMVDLTGSV